MYTSVISKTVPMGNLFVCETCASKSRFLLSFFPFFFQMVQNQYEIDNYFIFEIFFLNLFCLSPEDCINFYFIIQPIKIVDETGFRA